MNIEKNIKIRVLLSQLIFILIYPTPSTRFSENLRTLTELFIVQLGIV